MVHNQGYPRLDVVVLKEQVLAAVPAMLKVRGREDDLQAYVDGFLDDVAKSYAALEPDDTFIHWDTTDVRYVGPGGGGSVNFDALQKILDTQIIAGLKQLPIMLGRNDGSTTTHATIQWRIQALQIAAMQRVTKRMVEWAHNTFLDLNGFAARAYVTFRTEPVDDALADAQARQLAVVAWQAMVAEGWADADEAAMALLGHKKKGEKVATVAATGASGDTGTGAAQDGEPAPE